MPRLSRFPRTVATALAAAALYFAPAPATAAAYTVDETARLLAGLPITSAAEAPEFKAHADMMNKRWAELDAKRLRAIRAWSAKVLEPKVGKSAQLFYPFSGPDFIYANAMFPSATEIVMLGLEPVGLMPDFAAQTPEQRKTYLADAVNSLSAVVNFSFFKTNDMKTDFAEDKLRGVTPILMLFVVRSGAHLERVRAVRPTADGAFEDAPFDGAEVVEVSYRYPGDAASRRILYYSVDISNGKRKLKTDLFQYVEARGPQTVFIKSASYLMHKGYFSEIRALILKVGRVVLQDDSGIPLKHLQQAGYQITYFGTYEKPTKLFTDWQQDDLVQAYAAKAEKLPFGIGYHINRAQSNLQLAERR
jgi:hypothetical protein